MLVADGTYDGTVQHPGHRRRGRPDHLRLGEQVGRQAGRRTDDRTTDAVWRNYGDYVDIQGFDISGSLTDGILQTGSYGRIVENRVHGLTEGCISTYKDDYSMVDNDIIGNVVFGCGTNQAAPRHLPRRARAARSATTSPTATPGSGSTAGTTATTR